MLLRFYTGDFQSKAFQGRYLEHSEFQELLNISLADLFYLLS